ncbi:MAG: TonB-dependent receptor, partial [Acidobacteria bacterium]
MKKIVHLCTPVMSRATTRFGALCLLLLAISARPLSAQAIIAAAAVTGSVDDPSGAAIDGAQLSATNLETAQRWTTASGPDGRFRFMSLPPGDYRVEAVHDGFQAQTARVTLTAGRALDVPLHLKVAGLSESVSVRADLHVVDVARTQAAESVSPAEIAGLPLNGRNYLDLALLAPGASRTNTRSTERYSETSAVPGTGLSINGQRNLSNTFLVDGLSANDDAAGLSGVHLSEEVIREFQVVNAGGLAEFGRAGSGAVSVVTQSGSEHLHGRSYWYGRHGRLDARNPLATRKDPLSQSQYGLTLGGPLPIARSFAFGNLEQMRQQRRGLVTIAGEAIAAIDTALDRFGYRGPRPQSGDYPTGDDTTNVFVKLDHQRAGGARLTGRYTLYSLSSANARGAGGLNDASRGTALENRDQSWSAALVVPLSSRLLNEARAQVMRGRLAAPPNDLVGPAVNISGVASLGMATSSPTARDADVYQVADSVSWQRGSHLVKGGVDALWNRVTIAFPGALRGAYTFSSLANLAVGRYISYQQAFGSASQFQSNPNLGLFAQDEWRLRRDLTVNAGVRYDRQRLPKPIDADTGDLSPRLGVAWAPGSR